jgi:redox-sensitive bicupin YhaK (pirin superfamily)
MEIISIPLCGSLEHKDSNGNKHVIGVNDVQVMSAGTGITHSELNHSKTEEANFLQIWIIPDKRGHQPRYDQKEFDPEKRRDQLQLLIGTYCEEECLTINQKAWISRGSLKAGVEIDYHIHRPGNCVYCFIISGFAEISDQYLSSRDGIGICEADNFNIIAKEELDILIIEIPLYNE